MPTVTNPPPPADPGNDPDDPPTNPPTNPPPVPRRSISPELRELLGAGRSVSVRPPDTFDGSDQKKLQNFLLLLSIFFQSQPRRFSTDQHKVLFAISYLKGTPLDYFGPGIQAADLGEPEPLWLDDYPEFVRELKDNFGDQDPKGTAQTRLATLYMKHDQKFAEYLVKFNS